MCKVLVFDLKMWVKFVLVVLLLYLVTIDLRQKTTYQNKYKTHSKFANDGFSMDFAYDE